MSINGHKEIRRILKFQKFHWKSCFSTLCKNDKIIKKKLSIATKTVDETIKITNSFLQNIGLKTVDNPKFTGFSFENGKYGYKMVNIIEKKFNDQFVVRGTTLCMTLNMKFAKNEQLGVITASAMIIILICH